MGKEATGTYSLTPFGGDIADVLDVFLMEVKKGTSPAEIDFGYYYIRDMVEMSEERKANLFELLETLVALGILAYSE